MHRSNLKEVDIFLQYSGLHYKVKNYHSQEQTRLRNQSDTMPSRGNPNVPNKLKRKANRSKTQKRNATGKITKNPRGTAPSSVLHPTGGPAAPLSAKKARKVERALNHARRRALEATMAEEGEVVMTGEFCCERIMGRTQRERG
jgi:hypothetical protein